MWTKQQQHVLSTLQQEQPNIHQINNINNDDDDNGESTPSHSSFPSLSSDGVSSQNKSSSTLTTSSLPHSLTVFKQQVSSCFSSLIQNLIQVDQRNSEKNEKNKNHHHAIGISSTRNDDDDDGMDDDCGTYNNEISRVSLLIRNNSSMTTTTTATSTIKPTRRRRRIGTLLVEKEQEEQIDKYKPQKQSYQQTNFHQQHHHHHRTMLIIGLYLFLIIIIMIYLPTTISAFKIGSTLLGERFWNLTRGDSMMSDHSVVGELSEKFTHCRILPLYGGRRSRAILQWKFISNQTYQNYYPMFNDTQSSKSGSINSESNPIIRMRMIFGETPLDLSSNFKIFGFSKGVTSDEGFNTLYNNLVTSKMDDNGDYYRYFFDKELTDNRKIKIMDLMNQPQGTFHALYADGNPTFYVAHDNTSQPYLERYMGTITTTRGFDHFPTCNDDVNMAITPISFGERVNTVNGTNTSYSKFCVYQTLKFTPYTGGVYITLEKRLNSIVRPKNLPNTRTFSEDKLDSTTDYKYFVYYMPSMNSGFRNTTAQGQRNYLNSFIDKDNVRSYYLAHEVDFSKDNYDSDCDYYVNLYQTSIYDIFHYIRTVRHIVIGIISILFVGFLFIYRNKQPVKSRLHTAMISGIISILFCALGVFSNIYRVFNYDSIEYSYYLSLAMLYLVSLIRYMFVRNLYRVIRIVDKMEDTVISTGEFNDEGIVSNYKKKTKHMHFLSKLASKRIYISAICSIIIIVNLPTPFFLWLLHTGNTDVFAFVNTAIVYIKLIALIIGFVLPGLAALSFDMFINRKWLFYGFCKNIFDCGDSNISTYMSKVLKRTKQMEDFSCGFKTYFSDYDDPLFYRSEFLLVTSLSLVTGVSTFVVGMIDIPNWRTSLKMTLLLVHGALYFLFDFCYVLLTSGFVVIMQLISERRKLKSRRTIQDQKVTLTGKNPITLLLIKTIGDRTGEGRDLLYKFCCKEFSLEFLIMFERCCKILELIKARKYKTDPQAMNKKVCDIYNLFVKTRASLEVTMPYELKSKISTFLESFAVSDEQSVSTESSTNEQPRKIYAIFKATEQTSTTDNNGNTDNRSIDLVNDQTAVFISDLIDQLKEAALSNLQDTFTRLMATKAYMAYFKKKELEAQAMKQTGFAREDTIELDTNAIVLVVSPQQQQEQTTIRTTIDVGGTRVITSINTTPVQEEAKRKYLQTYENGDEIAISEDSTDPANEEETDEEDTCHSLDRIDD